MEEAKPELGVTGDAPVGWHSRGYLPRLDSFGVMQSITFRSADLLPREKLRQLEQGLAGRAETERDAARRRVIEEWLDAGIGCCALRHPHLAALMQMTFIPTPWRRGLVLLR